jgi:membrane protein
VFPPIRLRAALTLGGLTVRELVVRTWTKVDENEIMTRAAAVAFYAMMALVPFLAVILTITIALLPDLKGPSGAKIAFANTTVGELRQTLRSVFPSEASNVIEGQITRIQRQPTGGLVSIGLAAAFLLISLGFRVYVQGFAKYDRTYGSLGGVMMLLFWFWMSSLVLLTAAQINKLIEDASPLGRKIGQKNTSALAPDFEAMAPRS